VPATNVGTEEVKIDSSPTMIGIDIGENCCATNEVSSQ